MKNVRPAEASVNGSKSEIGASYDKILLFLLVPAVAEFIINMQANLIFSIYAGYGSLSFIFGQRLKNPKAHKPAIRS